MTPTTDVRIINSRVLGEVRASAEQILTLPTGLLGFPEAREFTLVATRRTGFYWLQSLDHAALTFLLMDPFVHVADYAIDLPDRELGDLGTDASDIVILGIVTLPAGAEDVLTVNLQGPLVLNTRKGIGRQIILEESPYGLRHAVDVEEALLAS